MSMDIGALGHSQGMGGDSDVRELTASSRGADGAAFDLTVSKLLRPLLRPDTIQRSLLIERLARSDEAVATVGAARGGRPFAAA